MKSNLVHRTQNILGLVTLSLVLLSSLALGANRPVSWSLLAIAVTLLFALQVILAYWQPVPTVLRKLLLPGLLILASILWAFVQVLPGIPAAFAHPVWLYAQEAPAFISADPGQGRHAVMRMMCYVMVFLIVLWSCVRTENAWRALCIVAIFSTLLAGFGLFAFATGDNIILTEATAGGIVQASFINRNNYATYAAFGVLANLACFLAMTEHSANGLRNRLEMFFRGSWLFALGALVCIGAVSLTQSRAGAAAGLIGLAVFIIAFRSGRTGSDRALLVTLAATLAFIGATSATGLLERIISTDAADGRFIVYPRIWQAIFDRPFLGHGAGTFLDAFRPYVPSEAAFGEWVFAHSTHLELLFGLGIPAALALYSGFFLIGVRLWYGARRRRNNRVYTCFALGCMTTAAVHSCFDFSLQMPATAALFAACLAMGIAQSLTFKERAAAKIDRREEDQE